MRNKRMAEKEYTNNISIIIYQMMISHVPNEMISHSTDEDTLFIK